MNLQNPIRAIDLPGVPDVELRGLIVVVGPNSSGKTQLLHDLNETVCGRVRQLVVASAVTLETPSPFEEYFEFLRERGTIRESGPDQYLKQSLQYGADEGAGSFRKTKMRTLHQQFSDAAQNKIIGSSPGYPYLVEMGPLSCSVLFLKNRLTLMDPCPNFDYKSQGPSKTLQSLYYNKDAKAALHSEIADVFQRAVWIDNTYHAQLVLRVADSTKLPDAEDRLEPIVMEMYRTIETEGDGLRSYTAICTTLLLEQRPLCLIDEPEMCLHPPQAHAIGRFIGEHTTNSGCTVVATHSSHVLRGILETNRGANVIRLTHINSEFQARVLTSDLLREATSKPRSRSENILEGLLSHVVVLVEAEGDRIVYESVYRTFKNRPFDIRFVPSEGTGGFADPLRLYRILKVPAAVVADVDFVAKAGELKRVLTELGVTDSDRDDLCTRARHAVQRISSDVDEIDFNGIQDELNILAQEEIDPTKIEVAKFRGRIHKIVNDLTTLHGLKENGLDAIGDQTLRSDMETLLNELGKVGLFLVPVGELESWLPTLMKGHSRENKSQWAMLAAGIIEDVGERKGEIWSFFRKVRRFLNRRLAQFAKP